MMQQENLNQLISNKISQLTAEQQNLAKQLKSNHLMLTVDAAAAQELGIATEAATHAKKVLPAPLEEAHNIIVQQYPNMQGNYERKYILDQITVGSKRRRTNLVTTGSGNSLEDHVATFAYVISFCLNSEVIKAKKKLKNELEDNRLTSYEKKSLTKEFEGLDKNIKDNIKTQAVQVASAMMSMLRYGEGKRVPIPTYNFSELLDDAYQSVFSVIGEPMSRESEANTEKLMAAYVTTRKLVSLAKEQWAKAPHRESETIAHWFMNARRDEVRDNDGKPLADGADFQLSPREYNDLKMDLHDLINEIYQNRNDLGGQLTRIEKINWLGDVLSGKKPVTYLSAAQCLGQMVDTLIEYHDSNATSSLTPRNSVEPSEETMQKVFLDIRRLAHCLLMGVYQKTEEQALSELKHKVILLVKGDETASKKKHTFRIEDGTRTQILDALFSYSGMSDGVTRRFGYESLAFAKGTDVNRMKDFVSQHILIDDSDSESVTRQKEELIEKLASTLSTGKLTVSREEIDEATTYEQAKKSESIKKLNRIRNSRKFDETEISHIVRAEKLSKSPQDDEPIPDEDTRRRPTVKQKLSDQRKRENSEYLGQDFEAATRRLDEKQGKANKHSIYGHSDDRQERPQSIEENTKPAADEETPSSNVDINSAKKAADSVGKTPS